MVGWWQVSSRLVADICKIKYTFFDSQLPLFQAIPLYAHAVLVADRQIFLEIKLYARVHAHKAARPFELLKAAKDITASSPANDIWWGLMSIYYQ